MTFTSQCGEDRWIADNWGRLGLPDVGFFVEFGAADGLCSSNTYWLEHGRGWRGLLAEPDPRWTIVGRPGCMVERVAIGPAGWHKFGLDPEPALSGLARPAAMSIDVMCEPLSSVLSRLGIERVDLLSIDTEGTELQAWSTLDLRRWQPRVAIIELFTLGMPDESAAIIDRLDHDGYSLRHRTEINGVFVLR